MSNNDFFGDPAESTVEQLPDVMLGLETMGTRPNAPIIAVGAVAFDLRRMVMGERYYANVDLASSVALGSVIDADTVIWWLKQSDEARKALTQGMKYDAASVLQGFSQWLTRCTVEHKARKVWACGIDFDCVLLSEHYRNNLLPVPWEFWNQRDYRTLRELWPNVEPEPRTGKHNALDDAIYQVEHMFKIRRTLRGNT